MMTDVMEHLSANELSNAFRECRPGHGFTYLTGDLALARHSRKRHPKYAELCLAGDMAWDFYAKGLACLTQRRAGRFRFDYIITKRVTPGPPPTQSGGQS